MDTNLLYYGDNLNILRKDIPSNSIDLVYLDPPFNSSRGYNIIFKDESGHGTDASILAFDDTWHWGPRAEEHYNYLTTTIANEGRVGEPLSRLVAALRSSLGVNQMTAYLVEMAARLVELHRVLKPTGSIYLHCDPTASHYLKAILDSIFGPERFRSEIVWKRTHSHGTSRNYGAVHDILLYYVKGEDFTWNRTMVKYSQSYAEKFFRNKDSDGRPYQAVILTGSGTRSGSSGNPWRGYDPTSIGRHWAIPGYMRSIIGPTATVQEALEKLDDLGRLVWPDHAVAPRFKQYLDDLGGTDLQDLWTDIAPLGSHEKERLGYPTQKPLALLDRILSVSTNEGDVVLDPFCGCGTALVSAQQLKRQWIGIDITYLSINVMRQRLADACGLKDVPVRGAPTEVEGARQLALSLPNGRYQFQFWALSLIPAGPVGGREKKGADRGIDGVTIFPEPMGERQQILVSVKSGRVQPSFVRDLKGVLDRETAAMGILITLEEPTAEMKLEATTAGFYHSKLADRDYPKVQIATIKDLLAGKKPELPPLLLPSYQSASKAKEVVGHAQDLFEGL